MRWCVLPETEPIISGFEYISSFEQRIFCANEAKVYDASRCPARRSRSPAAASGNYAAAQLANQAGDFLTAVNEAGDPPLRADGTAWTVLNSGEIVWACKPCRDR